MIEPMTHRGRPACGAARAAHRRPCGAVRAPVVRIPVVRILGVRILVAVLIAATLSQPVAAQTQAPAEPPPQTQAPPPQADAPEVERIKDWAVQCTTPAADKPRACFLIHDVFAIDNNQRILQLVVGHFGIENILGALIFVPMGIRLPPGITLQVDTNEPLQIALERCTQKGCQAQIALSDTLLATLKAGAGGEVTFEDATGRRVAVAYSLKGFTAALGKLP